MDKRALIVIVILAFSLLLTPMVLAQPATEKNNDKFEYFKFEYNGLQGTAEQEWTSPPTGMPKVAHSRGTPINSDGIVELTVGTETFDMTTEPYSVDYTETFDGERFFDNDGAIKGWHMRIITTITVYDEGEPIGTIVIKTQAIVVMGDSGPSIESAPINGFGTGELKGVHITGIDLGFTVIPPDVIFGREGTITGWPDDITND